MSPMLAGLIGVIIMIVVFAIGVPVGFAMGIVGIFGIWYLTSMGATVTMVGAIPYSLVSKYSFTVLPLFFLMANVCMHTGLSRDLFAMVYKWMGRMPGGLAAAAIGAATLFGAVSASAVATCLTIGLVALPEMKRYKYDDALATACVASGGVLGILIPPSATLIIYGIMTEQSIGELFIAGVIPGLVLALMFIGMIVGRCIINPKLGPIGPKFTVTEKVKSLGACFEMLLLIMVVISGLIIGWFTPTEAGAIGAAGAVVFSLLRKRLSWQGFKQALWETTGGVGMIYIMLIGAFIFNGFLALSAIPIELAGLISGLNIPPWVVIGLIILIYVVLGCFIDALPLILLTVPVFYPVVTAVGFDPIWFGILIVVMVGIGIITPPVGIGVYVIAGVAKDVPMSTIFKGILPFFIVEVIFSVILIVFPQIATWLPSVTR